MSLTVTLELTDRDLQHFSKMVDFARKSAEGMTNEQVFEAATQLLVKALQSEPPQFVCDRLELLDKMIAMGRDEGWPLSEEDAEHVRCALAYFAAPGDVIADHVAVLGYLDDAIMIELSARELGHEIDAYNDFCDYRELEAARHGVKPEAVGRADWLEARRIELQERMHRRRARDRGRGMGQGYGASSGYGAPRKTYTDGGWHPTYFNRR